MTQPTYRVTSSTLNFTKIRILLTIMITSVSILSKYRRRLHFIWRLQCDNWFKEPFKA